MELLEQIKEDFKIDRVPMQTLSSISYKIGAVLCFLIGFKISLSEPSVFKRIIILSLSVIIFILLNKLITYCITFFIGVPFTIFSKARKVNSNDKTFLRYAYERLDYLYSEKLIDKKHYYETLDILVDLEREE